MSLSGILNTHFIVAYLVAAHGTKEQRDYFLPRMATGEIRSALSMSEPDLGSDVAAIRTAAIRDGDDYVITGQKMWLTNGATSSLIALLAKTDEGGAKPHQNLTAFLSRRTLASARPGRAHRARQDPQARLPGRGHHRAATRRCSSSRQQGPRRAAWPRVLPGDGRYRGGTGDVAPRGCGVAHRAFQLAVAYSRQRKTFGKPIGDKAITFKLAEMATKVTAAHQMMVMAARRKAAGGQSDVEAGMAEYLAAGLLQGGCLGLAPYPRWLRLLDRARDRAALPRRAHAAHGWREPRKSRR